MVEEKVEAEIKEEAPRTNEQRIEALEDVMIELIDKVESLAKDFGGFKKQAVTKPKGLFGGKRTPTPMKDLKTGIVYPSKAAVGKAFGAEAGGDPGNTMVYYTVMKVLKMADGSDRFVPASEEEGVKAREDYKAQVQAEVDAANARLEAEQAAEAAKAAVPVQKAPVPKPIPPQKGKK